MADAIITPEARLSYPNLFVPRKINDTGEAKFSCALIFPKAADLSTLKTAAIAALRERWGAKADDMIRKKQVRLPFRSGSEKEQEGYDDDSTFINVTSKLQPGVVDRHRKPITDPSIVYPGCYVRASLGVFTYDTQGNKGVSFGLRNMQKIRDGEPLDGRRKAEDEFEAIEGEDEASQEDIDALLG